MVRFRNGAPGQRVISNAAIQDQETKFQDQETNAAMTGLDWAGRRDVAGQKWASGLRVSPELAVARLRGTENRAHRL